MGYTLNHYLALAKTFDQEEQYMKGIVLLNSILDVHPMHSNISNKKFEEIFDMVLNMCSKEYKRRPILLSFDTKLQKLFG